jgi:hypothetical protein
VSGAARAKTEGCALISFITAMFVMRRSGNTDSGFFLVQAYLAIVARVNRQHQDIHSECETDNFHGSKLIQKPAQ